MIKSYKYRLKPNTSQKNFFEKSFGCARYVYNWALDNKIKAYQNNKITLGWIDLCKMLVDLKQQKDTAWLNEVNSQSLQSSIRNMDNAYVRFFQKKNGFPKFKSKKTSYKSFQYSQRTKIDFKKCRIYVPKAGWVKFFKDHEFVGKIGTATISKTPTGKYFISLVVDDGIEKPAKLPINESTAVGIDVGIKNFATLSNGTVIPNPKFLEKAEGRLKVLQRRFSRTKNGSNRHERARYAVARQYEKIKNRRENFLHQITSRIIRENQTVVIEDLDVGHMLKNHRLAKSIMSASWYEFFRQLEYKCEWQGRNLLRIGRYEPSSRTCMCGHVNHELTLADRKWTCPKCGRRHDRDLLAAQNIKRFGLMKQDLTKYSPAGGGVEDVEGRGYEPDETSILKSPKGESK